MQPMYSMDWFDAFAATVPAELVAADVEAIARLLPLGEYPRVLDVGCGIGRIAAPLAECGYAVTGLDVSIDALRALRRRSPTVACVALDQRHVGRMRWRFDGALVLWSSLGYAGRRGDEEMLAGLAKVLRPGGRLVLDLYHPDWLRAHQLAGERDARGPIVRRWLDGGRCCNEIRYPSGHTDEIRFEVYGPDEIAALCRGAGLLRTSEMVWWNADSPPSRDAPRYQVLCSRA